MDYNTSQPPLILREYGRNVQKLVGFLKTIEDRDKRTAYAHTLISLMRQVTPSFKETQETEQKLWDDLFIMADFDLDIESPYPVPEPEVLTRKPKRLDYMSNRIKYKHYGRNIELLIKEAAAKEDPQEREEAIIYIGKLMKSFYSTWNKEVIDDSVILENIKTISDGELDINLDKVREDNLFERLYKNKKRTSGGRSSGKSGGGRSKGGSKHRRRRN